MVDFFDASIHKGRPRRVLRVSYLLGEFEIS